MPHYRVDSANSRIVVKARSSIHDTSTTWSRIDGTAEADPAALAQAHASFSVDMTAFDAGDWLKNRKLRKDLSLASHPTASFDLTTIRDLHQSDDGSFAAVADGILRWRGKEVPVAITGRGRIDAATVDVTGTFELDIRRLGVEPPRFLMFQVESEVTVEVTLRARA